MNFRDGENYESARQRGLALTSSVGLWEGPLGVTTTQCPYLKYDYTEPLPVPLTCDSGLLSRVQALFWVA
jgi:hypothetical protein